MKANEWINQIQKLINGKGGGKELSAQATGSNTDCVEEVKQIVTKYAEQKLKIVTCCQPSGKAAKVYPLVIISPDESRGYIGFRSVAPPPP